MDRQIIQLNVRRSVRQEEQFAVESSGHLLWSLFITWKKCWSKGMTGRQTLLIHHLLYFLGTLPLCLPAAEGCFKGLAACEAA